MGNVDLSCGSLLSKNTQKEMLTWIINNVFNDKSEYTFAEDNSNFCMNLSNRGGDLLVLDKRVCWSRSVFDDVNDWTDYKN